MRSCPACAEQVQDDARVCRFCGYDFKRKRNPQLGKGDLAGCAISGCALWIFAPFLVIILLAAIGTFIGRTSSPPAATTVDQRAIDQEAMNSN